MKGIICVIIILFSCISNSEDNRKTLTKEECKKLHLLMYLMSQSDEERNYSLTSYAGKCDSNAK